MIPKTRNRNRPEKDWGFEMSKLFALSLSIGLLGAVWCYLALGPLSPWVLVWAGFIAWACFFHSGANESALSKTITGNIYGIVVGWIALGIIVNVPVPALGTIWPALVVGVTAFCLVIVATIEPLSVVPANVYGYASIVAYSLHHKPAEGAGPLASLFAPSFANPLLLLILSMVIGAVFGYLSAKLADMLASKSMTAARA